MSMNTPLGAVQTQCKSCGASFPLQSRASIQVVCPYCRSCLVRNELDWEEAGKMAMVASDLSPFAIGMRGQFRNTGFTIIGRIQQQYEDGYWNEWLLFLDNGKDCWLSEGSGLFYLSKETPFDELIPTANELQLDQQLMLAGKPYQVSNIETAACVATEGEIPFTAHPGEKNLLVDLQNTAGLFATLDFSDSKPKLYTGRVVGLEELHLKNANQKEAAKVHTKDLRCAGCGNAVATQDPNSLMVVCSSCKTVNDVSPEGKLIRAYSQAEKQLSPKLPIGTKGVLDGAAWEVIGYMRRTGGGGYWDEYLLFNAKLGVRWLVCSDGHWSFVKTCSKPSVNAGGNIYYLGRSYKHYASYSSTVDGVLGEFYWRVKKNDKAECADFISPPYVISSEKSAKETTWSMGEYLSVDAVEKAFGKNVSRLMGVGMNQPSPRFWEYLMVYIGVMLFATIVTILVHWKSAELTYIGELDFSQPNAPSTLVSEPFELKRSHGMFRIRASTNVSNSWAALQFRLINQATGDVRVLDREVSYYSGYDEGYWEEGSAYDSGDVPDVKAGTYVLEVDAEAAPADRDKLRVKIDSQYGIVNTHNFLLLAGFLFLFPLVAGLNKYYFEKRRWDNSDHPWETGE